MFEPLTARAARAAERRARERAAALAEEIRAVLPGDIRVEAEAQGVRLSGRALRRRLALDSALRWTLLGLTR